MGTNPITAIRELKKVFPNAVNKQNREVKLAHYSKEVCQRTHSQIVVQGKLNLNNDLEKTILNLSKQKHSSRKEHSSQESIF